jgi:hypothetical protein
LTTADWYVRGPLRSAAEEQLTGAHHWVNRFRLFVAYEIVSTYVDEHFNYQPHRPMKQWSDDENEQAYIMYVHSYYVKHKRLPEYGALQNYWMKATIEDLQTMTMNLWTAIACELTRKCSDSALYFSIRDTEFGEDITKTDPKHRSTKGYIICTAVAKLRVELFPRGHHGPSAQWYYPGIEQVMGTISR